MSDFTIRRLDIDEDRPSFDCGDDDLNEFYAVDSKHNAKHLMAVTYVVERGGSVVAFFSLSNDSIKKQNLRPGVFDVITDLIPSQKRYSTLPAVKIGRLATSCSCQSSGIGSDILDYLKYWFTTGNKTGCRFIVVDAYNNSRTLQFYNRNGFSFLQDSDIERKTRLMIFDLMTVLD